MPDENYYKPLTGFKNYELQPGDRLKFFKGLGIWTHHEPDYVEVVDENPLFIVCDYIYGENHYKRCVNKALIVSGDISFQKVAA